MTCSDEMFRPLHNGGDAKASLLKHLKDGENGATLREAEPLLITINLYLFSIPNGNDE